MAIFRTEVVGLHAILGDGVGIDLHDLVGEALIAGAVGIVVDAIEHEVVGFGALSVYVVRGVAAGEGPVFQLGLAHTGHQQGKVGIGAAVERQVHYFARGDHAAALAGIGFQDFGGAIHHHGLGGGPNFER